MHLKYFFQTCQGKFQHDQDSLVCRSLLQTQVQRTVIMLHKKYTLLYTQSRMLKGQTCRLFPLLCQQSQNKHAWDMPHCYLQFKRPDISCKKFLSIQTSHNYSTFCHTALNHALARAVVKASLRFSFSTNMSRFQTMETKPLKSPCLIHYYILKCYTPQMASSGPSLSPLLKKLNAHELFCTLTLTHSLPAI